MFSLFLAVFLLFFACRLLFFFFVRGPRSRKMDRWSPLHLRCIVVKATQVLESRLVAELVLVLGGRQERGRGQRKINKMLNRAGERQLSHKYSVDLESN